MHIREYRSTDRVSLIESIAHLQDYISALDPLQRERPASDFNAASYVDATLQEIHASEGIIFVAEDQEKIVGCIAGIIVTVRGISAIESYPIRDGKILELVVDSAYRRKGVGLLLLKKIEQYFLEKNCDAIIVDCFAPNTSAHLFYMSDGYTDRVQSLIKPLKKNGASDGNRTHDIQDHNLAL